MITPTPTPNGKKIRVMIVDDSAMVRKVLRDILSTDPEIDVIYAASNPYEARDVMVVQKPDVITLDIEMPKMDGVTFLKKFMRVMPTPTIIISSLAESGKKITIEALEAGAVDIITKPKIGLSDFFDQQVADIIQRVKTAAKAKVQLPSVLNNAATSPIKMATLEETTDKVIAIGASTGGVEHLSRIMPLFPATSPGIVIVQHMPEGFTASFAKRLNELSAMQVKEAQDGDRILPGLVLLAPGGKQHMSVYRSGGQYRVRLQEGEKVSFNRPAVDVLFESVAEAVGKNCSTVLMTGMGKDGAKGLLKIRQAGGKTFIQNEATCVIYGMPGEADRMGAASAAVPLLDIPQTLLSAFRS
jgi:two-component system chemotaxis response regulator CheB